jgi:peptidoglycan/LPS O-acetylase OafA/YrhL
MSHLLALVLCLIGFGALACAMKRQQRDLFGKALGPARIRMLRLAGSAALLGALAVLVAQFGWGLGLVMFSGHTSLAAGVVVCVLIGYARTQDVNQRHRSGR